MGGNKDGKGTPEMSKGRDALLHPHKYKNILYFKLNTLFENN
jgi:hypothetical protein